jgi:hypothetical protein
MMSVRNCSGVSGTHMAGDMDEEGLIAFNAMAQEAMKIERLVIQQKELSKSNYIFYIQYLKKQK